VKHLLSVVRQSPVQLGAFVFILATALELLFRQPLYVALPVALVVSVISSVQARQRIRRSQFRDEPRN